MFAFVSAFPKSLHCTDEAQQAETVLCAILSIKLLFLRAGEIPVFPRQRYRAVHWLLPCHLRGHMYPSFGSLQPEFVEHFIRLLGDALSLAIGQSSLPQWFEQSGMAWCFLAPQAWSTREGINVPICVSLSQVSALH